MIAYEAEQARLKDLANERERVREEEEARKGRERRKGRRRYNGITSSVSVSLLIVMFVSSHW